MLHRAYCLASIVLNSHVPFSSLSYTHNLGATSDSGSCYLFQDFAVYERYEDC